MLPQSLSSTLKARTLALAGQTPPANTQINTRAAHNEAVEQLCNAGEFATCTSMASGHGHVKPDISFAREAGA